MATLDSILNDALALPTADRGRLIQRLIESLDDGEAEAGAEDEWAELIARRIADLDAGTARTIDGKAAIARAREELARRRHG